ncbi:MAG: thioesterase family protein [Actinomycetota bacterium]|nr:thioesterase family protein [Actinomycetota bacterium]
MGFRFDDDTAVNNDGEGRFRAEISGAWNIDVNPNGGYLAAVLIAAMRQVTPHTDPLTVTVHFLLPATSGAPAEISGELVRAGRRVSTVRATLIQDGTARLEAIGSFGHLGETASPTLTVPAPTLPPPEDCQPRSPQEQGVILHLEEHVQTLIHPLGSNDRAETTGWIRFRDGRPPDLLALALFVDAFPPSIFRLLGRVGWVPTIELTIHFRGRPVSGWVRGRFLTDDVVDGRMIETGALWDSTGALVARSRQLALLVPIKETLGPDL